MLKPKTAENQWARESHHAKAHALPGLIIDITPPGLACRAPAPEQDARQVAKSQRNRAQVFAQRDVLEALRCAQVALEPKETALERAAGWLREMMGGVRLMKAHYTCSVSIGSFDVTVHGSPSWFRWYEVKFRSLVFKNEKPPGVGEVSLEAAVAAAITRASDVLADWSAYAKGIAIGQVQ